MNSISEQVVFLDFTDGKFEVRGYRTYVNLIVDSTGYTNHTRLLSDRLSALVAPNAARYL